jgi:phosphoglycerol transferase MdoB-like AlkP superfamily enzyme
MLKRAFRSLPLAVSTIIGAFCTYIGWRYIVFFSGGSGFVVPVPTLTVIIFFDGLALLVSGALAYWRPRISAVMALVGLLVLVALLVQQTFVHPRPTEVIAQRGIFAALLAAVAVAIWMGNLRRPNRKPA